MHAVRCPSRRDLCLIVAISCSSVAAYAKDKPEVGYDNGFFIESKDGEHRLRVNARVQTRLDYSRTLDPDNTVETLRFSIPRIRLKFGGHVFTKKLRYSVNVGWDDGQAGLKDGFLEYRAHTAARIKAGQFKLPYSREQLGSSTKLAFGDRSIVHDKFDHNRNLGVMVHNGVGTGEGLRYGVGVFNGTSVKPTISGEVLVDTTTGEGTITDTDVDSVPAFFQPMVAGRIMWASDDTDFYEPLDLKGGGARGGIGANVLANFGVAETLDSSQDAQYVHAGLDAAFKVSGFSLVATALFKAESDGTTLGVTPTDLGLLAEASYVIGSRVAPAIRSARVFELDDEEYDQEITGGVSVLLFGHGFRWIGEVSYLVDDADAGTVQARTQLQARF